MPDWFDSQITKEQVDILANDKVFMNSLVEKKSFNYKDCLQVVASSVTLSQIVEKINTPAKQHIDNFDNKLDIGDDYKNEVYEKINYLTFIMKNPNQSFKVKIGDKEYTILCCRNLLEKFESFFSKDFVESLKDDLKSKFGVGNCIMYTNKKKKDKYSFLKKWSLFSLLEQLEVKKQEENVTVEEAQCIENVIGKINNKIRKLFDTYKQYDNVDTGEKLAEYKTKRKYTIKDGDISEIEDNEESTYNIFEKDCEIIDRIRKELNLQLFENPNFSGDIELKDFINNRKFDKDKLLSKIDDFIKKEGLKQEDINKIFNSYEYDIYKKEIEYLIENEQSFLNRIVNEVLTGEDKLSFNLNQFVHWKKLENKPLQDIITSINNTSKEEFDTKGIDEVSVKARMKEAILKYLLSVSVPDWLTEAGISSEDILLSSQDNGFMQKLREELKQPGNVSLQDIIKNIDESIEQQEKIIEKIINNNDENTNNVKNEIKGKIKSYIEAKKDQVEGYIIPEFLTEAGISKRDIMLLEQNKDLKEELIKKLEPIGNIFDEKTTFKENDSLKNIIGKVLEFEYKKENKNIKVEKLKEEVEKLEKTLHEITDDNKQVENKTKDDYIKDISTVKKQIKDMARKNIETRQRKLCYKELDEKKKKVIGIIKDLRKKNIEDGFYVPYWFGYYSNGNPINRADIKLLEADKKAVEDIFYTDHKAAVEMVNKIKGDTNFQKLINYIKFRFKHRREFFKEEFYQENSKRVKLAFNNLLKRVNEKIEKKMERIEKKMEQPEIAKLVAQGTQLKKGGLLDISDSLIEFLEKNEKDFVNEIMSDIANYIFGDRDKYNLIYECLNVGYMMCLLQNSNSDLKQIAEIGESKDLKEIITKLDKLSFSVSTGRRMIEIIGDMRRRVSNAILEFGDSEIEKKGFGSCGFCNAMHRGDGNWLNKAGIGKGDVILLKQNEEFKNMMSEIVKWLSDSKLTITCRNGKVYRLDELNLEDQDWFPKIIEIIEELSFFQRKIRYMEINEEKEIKRQIDQLSQREKEEVKQQLIKDFKDFINLDKGDELYNIIGKIDEELASMENNIEIKKREIEIKKREILKENKNEIKNAVNKIKKDAEAKVPNIPGWLKEGISEEEVRGRIVLQYSDSDSIENFKNEINTIDEQVKDNEAKDNKIRDVKKQIKDIAKANIETRQKDIETRQKKLYKEVDEKKENVIKIITDLKKKKIEDGFNIPQWLTDGGITPAHIKLLELNGDKVQDIFYRTYESKVNSVNDVNEIKGDTKFQKLTNYIQNRYEAFSNMKKYHHKDIERFSSYFDAGLKGVNPKIKDKLNSICESIKSAVKSSSIIESEMKKFEEITTYYRKVKKYCVEDEKKPKYEVKIDEDIVKFSFSADMINNCMSEKEINILKDKLKAIMPKKEYNDFIKSNPGNHAMIVRLVRISKKDNLPTVTVKKDIEALNESLKSIVEKAKKIKEKKIDFEFPEIDQICKERLYPEIEKVIKILGDKGLVDVNKYKGKSNIEIWGSLEHEVSSLDTKMWHTMIGKGSSLVALDDFFIKFLEKNEKDFVNDIMSEMATTMFNDGDAIMECLDEDYIIYLLQDKNSSLKTIAEIKESKDLKNIITKLDELASTNPKGDKINKINKIINDMKKRVLDVIGTFEMEGMNEIIVPKFLKEIGITKRDIMLLKQNEEFKNMMSEIVKWLSDSKLTITGRYGKVYRLDELNLKDQDWFPKIINIIDELLFQREDKSRQGDIKITEEKEIKGQIDQLSQEEKEKVKQQLIEDFKDFNLDEGDELYNIIGKIDEELNSRETDIEIKKQGIKKNLSKSIEELLVSSDVPLGLDNAGTVKQIEDAFNDVKETISKELEKAKKDFKTKFKDEIEGFRGWISGDKKEDIEEDIIMLLQDENFEKKFLEDIKSSYPKLGLTENVKIQDIVKNNGKFISQKMVDEREAEKSRKEGERLKVIDTINTIKNKAIKNKAIKFKEILKQEDNEDNEINTDMIIQKQENEDEDKTLQEQVKGILSNRVSGLISGQMHKSDSMVIGIEKMDGYPKAEEERKIYRDEKLAEIDNEIQMLIADNLLPIVNGKAEKMDMIKVAKSIGRKA